MVGVLILFYKIEIKVFPSSESESEFRTPTKFSDSTAHQATSHLLLFLIFSYAFSLKSYFSFIYFSIKYNLCAFIIFQCSHILLHSINLTRFSALTWHSITLLFLYPLNLLTLFFSEFPFILNFSLLYYEVSIYRFRFISTTRDGRFILSCSALLISFFDDFAHSCVFAAFHFLSPLPPFSILHPPSSSSVLPGLVSSIQLCLSWFVL